MNSSQSNHYDFEVSFSKMSRPHYRWTRYGCMNDAVREQHRRIRLLVVPLSSVLDWFEHACDRNDLKDYCPISDLSFTSKMLLPNT